ncbi:MAG: ABC transporter permease [Thermoplasmata archaeon]|nr:ABC transporter permease [Thermoplasmata archaeon]
MNPTVSPRPAAPQGSFRAVLRLQWRLTLREPSGIALGLGLPVFLFAIFAVIPAFHQTVPGTHLNVFELYIPILLATSVIMISLVGLVPPIVRDREIGWLRRLSTTPVSPAQLLAAQVVIYLLVVAIVTAVFVVGGILVTGVTHLPQFGGFILALLLGTAAMFALGLLLAAIAPDQKAMQRILPVVLYPLLFFSGLYFPLQFLPSAFLTIGDYTPIGAAVEGMTEALQGSLPSPVALATTTVYAIVFGYLAVRFFRWE